MRPAGLTLGVLAVLIAAAVSFVAGYVVGKGEHPADAPRVALADQADPANAGLPSESGYSPDPHPHQQQTGARAEVDGPAAVVPDAAKASGQDTEFRGDALHEPKIDAAGTAPKAKPGATPGSSTEAEGMTGFDASDLFNQPKVPFAASISGIVTDTNGTPIAGADVNGTFSEMHHAGTGGSRISFALAGAGGGQRMATTDGAGNFRIDIQREVAEKASLSVNLTATAAGYAESERQGISLRNGDNKDGIKLVVRQAGSISGRVVDQSGRGVAGVNVSLNAPQQPGGFAVRLGGGVGQSATTDAAGEYRIEGVPEGRHALEVSAHGYRQVSGPSVVQAQPGMDTRVSADFVLEAVASIRVTLQSPEGLPLKKAMVTLKVTEATGRTRTMRARADDNGVVVFNDPPVGTFDVEVSAWGFAAQKVPATIVERVQTELGVITLQPSPGAGGIDIFD